MTESREPDSITFADVVAARKRLDGTVTRSPLIRLESDGPGELYVKLENLQPIRSFKLRGAANAMAMLNAAHQTSLHVYRVGPISWSPRRLRNP